MRQRAYVEHAGSLESTKKATLASLVLSKLPKCSISRHTHRWSTNQLLYNIIKAITAEVYLKFYHYSARLKQFGQCLRDIFFNLTVMFFLETERKFTHVASDNPQKYCKIHIEVPENY